MNFKIRSADPSEVNILAALHVVSWKAAYKGMLPDAYLNSLTVNRRAEKWEKHFRDSQIIIRISEDQGQICGFCFGGPSRDDDVDSTSVGEIHAIYLSPDYWGRGVGYPLCKSVMNELFLKKYAEATLWVIRENLRAQSFYKKLGFWPDGSSKVKTKAPGIYLDEIRYRCLLS